MKTSPLGLYAIAKHEGIVPAPYLDPVGVWTVFIGHAETSGLAPNPRHMPKGMPEDLDRAIHEAFDLFRKRIAVYERGVKAAVKVPLAQHEFDALVGFHFNTGAIGKASATRVLNEGGDKREVVRRLKLYNKAGGKVLRGLVARREEEGRMFLAGDYPSDPIPVFAVTSSNKVGKVIRTMSKGEALALLGGAHAPSRPSAPSTPGNPLSALLRALVAFLNRIFGGKT